MTISEMQSLKQEYGFSCRFIADESGVPFGTVQKIFGGSTASPRQVTLKSLSEFFEKNTSIGKTYKNYSDAYQMNEPEAYYTGTSAYKITDDDRKLATDDQKHQNDGGKTIKDYLSLPEGTRVELIDGKFYDMAAPTTIHQDIISEILFEFKLFIRNNEGLCKPFAAPTDVQLDCDDKTMVQPDVFIVCEIVRLYWQEIKLRYTISVNYGLDVLNSSRSDMADKLFIKYYSEFSNLQPYQWRESYGKTFLQPQFLSGFPEKQLWTVF